MLMYNMDSNVHKQLNSLIGVGGGIMGVIPRRMGIAVFGPALDKHGNSVAGIRLLSKLSQELDLSIY